MSGSISPSKSPDDAYLEILKEKGLDHERAYFERLKSEGKSSIEIERHESSTIEEMAERTRQAMRDGIDVIFQGALTAPGWHGYSDFLLKVDTPSDLGPWSYEVADTKLARTAKPKHVVQLCLYSEIIAREQGARPEHAHIVLGDGTEFKVRLHDYLYYCNHTQERFNQFVSGDERDTVAKRCPHCGLCRWSERCDEEWERDGNLRLAAEPGASQAQTLGAEGIKLSLSSHVSTLR